MDVHVADHPLIAHKLTYLRDKRTDSPTFRRLAEELVTLLAYEATRDVRVEPFEIETPVAPTTGIKLSNPKPIIVPILRAGLGMLDGMVKLLPSAEVGFLGMIRNEETLEVSTYANRLPDDLTGRQVFILDPMLATGGTLVMAIDYLTAKGARDITAVCLLAAPEGIKHLEDELSDSARRPSSRRPLGPRCRPDGTPGTRRIPCASTGGGGCEPRASLPQAVR